MIRDLAILVLGCIAGIVIWAIIASVAALAGAADFPGLVPCFFLTFFGVPVALYYSVKKRAARGRADAALAEGFSLAENGNEDLSWRLKAFPTFSQTSGKVAPGHLRASIDGIDMWAFEYSYTRVAKVPWWMLLLATPEGLNDGEFPLANRDSLRVQSRDLAPVLSTSTQSASSRDSGIRIFAWPRSDDSLGLLQEVCTARFRDGAHPRAV